MICIEFNNAQVFLLNIRRILYRHHERVKLKSVNCLSNFTMAGLGSVCLCLCALTCMLVVQLNISKKSVLCIDYFEYIDTAKTPQIIGLKPQSVLWHTTMCRLCFLRLLLLLLFSLSFALKFWRW